MKRLTKTWTAALAIGVASLASPALAHGVESHTITLPSIAPGASHAVTITCSGHHYVLSGGFDGDNADLTGTLAITGSHPGSTRSWVIELTNESGRPTAINEVTATFYALCGYRH